jgi:hypothetical protein
MAFAQPRRAPTACAVALAVAQGDGVNAKL